VRFLFRWTKRLVLLVVLLILGLLSPVLYIETMCRPEGEAIPREPMVGAEWARPEGRTF
jgi:hypothetical protein